MILVFGGTTEGKNVAAVLEELNITYYYSTKTEVPFSGKGIPIYGALTKNKIEEFCQENKVKIIINASHPFAEQLHETIASIDTQIPLIRFEREFTKRKDHKLVHYVNSFNEAISFFKEHKLQSLLALSGVQTIQRLTNYWKRYTTWFRILDRDSSREIAKQVGFQLSNIIYGYPQNTEEEVALFIRLNPSVIFTKESGVNGKLEQKIQAAIRVKRPIVILKKPLLSNRYLCVNSKEELIAILKNTIE
ncbi:precorrin-6A/cobalt-precorrin-6A reductase [Tenacibaculum sp. MAR_2009_124]|uniref:precorrin-6A/cobalt-precorrin-6A reductase n=1 Tax=Tenacibaculum sp. MAR_2009_124 TaxID=1250059 RepID=UPI0008990EF4|nr:precorrin-6A/cobalt-precorrin-6A reductase [Tenacibaculum sp. MAR_2009_124]SEB85989.1 precorrin-6A/cobalt-precorrin-6A reductase [Tenacibaculum sp. MAR_2009_124]